MLRILQGSADEVNAILMELQEQGDHITTIETFSDTLFNLDFPENDKIVITMIVKIRPESHK